MNDGFLLRLNQVWPDGADLRFIGDAHVVLERAVLARALRSLLSN
jgi:hypothetical protein